MFFELCDLCYCFVLMVFMLDEYCVFGDGFFLVLVEIIMDFVVCDFVCVGEYIVLGFEVMWCVLICEE